MKKLLVILMLLNHFNNYSQIGPPSTPSALSTMVQNNVIGTTTWRTITPNPIYEAIIAKGTESWTNNAWSIVLPNYATLRDDGFPKRIVFIDSLTGALKVSGNYAFDSRYLKISDSTKYTTRYYLQNNYFTKTQSDSKYLQSFTEVDPIFTASPSFGITSTNISNWNTAFGWGNHIGLYPTNSGTGATGTWGINISGNANTVTNGLYSTNTYNNPTWLNTLNWNKITNTPTSLGGYGITDGVDITTFNNALATKFNTPTGTTSQYIRGDGSIATFPTIPSAQVNSDWNAVSGVSQILNKPTLFSGSYDDLTNKPDLSTYYLNSNPSGFISNLSTFTTTNLLEGSNLYFTNTRARSSISQGTGITYNASTGVITNSAPDQTVTITSGAGIQITGTYPSFTVVNTAVTPTINNSVIRTLNNNYTISATRLAEVSYSVTCTVTNPLLVGTSTATAYLEYSVNGGSSWATVNQTGNTSGVGLAVAVAITNSQTTTLTGTIPANATVRIRTTTSGTASVTYVIGQEILY